MNFEDKVEFAIKHSLNLLAEGKHGCGKSGGILSVFHSLGYTNDIKSEDKVYSYFNAPVIDVYEDIKGIPANENGKLIYIRPEHRVWDKVELVFFDEVNRAHIKVVNTLYELIQFRSINGIKLPNLRSVFVAMNPSDEDYTVESCDQSFYDRFHLHVSVVPELSKKFFLDVKKIEEGVFHQINSWWKAIPENIRDKHASPRRIEYCIDVFNFGGDINDVIPGSCNPDRLFKILSKTESIINTYDYTKFSIDDWKNFLSDYDNPNFKEKFSEYILGIPDELLVSEFPYDKNDRNGSTEKLHKFISYLNGLGLLTQVVVTKLSCSSSILAQIIKTAAIDRTIRIFAHQKLTEQAPYLANKLKVY